MDKENFVIQAFGSKDLEGKPRAFIVAKGTWKITDAGLVPAEEPYPFYFVDVFEDPDDPTKSVVLFEADTAITKVGTDLVVLGTAYAPEGREVESFNVAVSVGSFTRELLILGPRRAKFRGSEKNPKPPEFTEPQKIKQLEVSFKFAYGGTTQYALPDGSDPVELPCPTNPIGMGYVVQNIPELVDNLPLPQIEFVDKRLRPEDLVQDLTNSDNVPLPAGFGFYGKSWRPRVDYLGVMPYEKEDVKRIMAEHGSLNSESGVPTPIAGFEPPIMQPEFYSAAAPYNVIKPYLNGNETVVMTNFTKSGQLSFYLPGIHPYVEIDTGNGFQRIESNLDTLVIMPDKKDVVIAFRGSIGISEEALDDVPEMPIKVELLNLQEYKNKMG